MPSTMLLECSLDGDDVDRKRGDIVKLLNVMETQNGELERLKSRQKSVKASQGETQGKIDQIRMEINERVEHREVEIEDVREGAFIVTRRKDNGSQVHKRRLSPSEKSDDKEEREESEGREKPPKRPKKIKEPKEKKPRAGSKASNKWAIADKKADGVDD